MSPEAQQIAIAEACGYSISDKEANGIVTVLKHGKFHTCFSGKRIGNPTLANALEKKCDYLNDLNAMHEAEKLLGPEQAIQYRIWLMSNSDGRKAVFPSVEAAMCHATAAQRAEAFLKCLGLWKGDACHKRPTNDYRNHLSKI